MLFLSSFGGYVGDHYNRHRAVIWTQSAFMFLAFLLSGLAFAHTAHVWPFIAIAFLVGVVNSFDVPIRQAFIVQMVGKEHLPNAIALNSSIFNGARVVGPAIAGFAIIWLGEGWCFFLNGVSFLAVIGALWAMRIERVESKPAEGSAWGNFVKGFHYAMSDLPMRSALILLSVLSLLGLQYSVFMPIFANDIFHGTARTLGLLMSAAGVGAVFGALHFAARTNYKGLARFIAATSFTCSVGLIIFSQSRIFLLSAAVLMIVGFASTAHMAATNTIIQSRVPDELRGRVMAVYATMFMGIQPVGALLAGIVAHRWGAPLTLTIFGGICLIGSLVFIFLVLPRIQQERAASQAA
jgi:MFS family permease